MTNFKNELMHMHWVEPFFLLLFSIIVINSNMLVIGICYYFGDYNLINKISDEKKKMN